MRGAGSIDRAALFVAACAALAGCRAEDAPASGGNAPTLAIEISNGLLKQLRSMSPLPPPPPSPTNRMADSPAAARLGQALFFDERFSANGSVSCATCHSPETGLTDGRQLAVGISEGSRHTPTLWNVAYHRWVTWDGRADSLWMQALDPLEDPREMGTTRGAVARTILGDEDLRLAYIDVFGTIPAGLAESVAALPSSGARPARSSDDGEPGSVAAWLALDAGQRGAIDTLFVNAGKSIAAYQRKLIRGDSPFDRFVKQLAESPSGGAMLLQGPTTESQPDGNEPTLDAAAQRGLALFFGRGNCVLCHSGPNFSDGEFHNNALPTLSGNEPIDAGRYAGAKVLVASEFNAAGSHSDAPDGADAAAVRSLNLTSETWGEFRTPSLRNLGGRAPFMHQGQFASLDDVMTFYSEMAGATSRSHHQEQFLVALRLNDAERAELLGFLESLNGSKVDPALLHAPSSARVPKR